jgi:hypothetical protein
MNPCGILIFAHPNGFKEVHGFRGSRVQGFIWFKGSGVQGFMGSWVQGFIWFRVQRFRVNQMNP